LTALGAHAAGFAAARRCLRFLVFEAVAAEIIAFKCLSFSS